MRRIGIVFTAPLAHLRDVVATVRRTEELGFSSAWQAEDPGGPDAISLLASYAATTTRLRLGTAITTPYARHPALLASTFAALDDLSGGRTILGLGAGTGWWDRLTLDRDALKPVRDMAETVRAFREFISQGETVYKGRHIHLRHAFPWNSGPLPPLVRDTIPVYLGAQGPLMTQLAGRVADGLILEISPMATSTTERILAFHTAARDAGRDPASLHVVGLAMMGVWPDGQVAPHILQKWVAPRLCRLDDARAAARGFDLDRMAGIRQAVAEGRHADAATYLTPDMIKACGAFGTPDECLAGLEEMVAAGVHEPIIFVVGGDTQLALDVGATFAAGGDR